MNGRRAEETNTGGIERRGDVGDEAVFLFTRNVFENVERISTIKPASQGLAHHVMDQAFEFPARAHVLINAFDKKWIKIDRGNGFDLLGDDSGAEGIGATDLEDALHAAEH